jgi:hypothetical protein
MQFKHCGVHQIEFDRLICDVRAERGITGFPIVVACPQCHEWYFSDLAPKDVLSQLAGLLLKAERVLVEDCPDHAHRFGVELFTGR